MLGPEIDDRHVFALDKAGVLQSLAKCAQKVRVEVGRRGTEHADHWHRLLRARRERPRRSRSADQRDELAPPHSITSSARPVRGSGTVRPSALAVLRLRTSVYLTARWTGSSAGFSPLRMRSTKLAACRNWSGRLTMAP